MSHEENKKRLQATGQLIVNDLTSMQLILPMNNNIYCIESSGTGYNRNQQKMTEIKAKHKGRP